ncbi:MAG: DinB family protein [Tepidiformaceae bacterium]
MNDALAMLAATPKKVAHLVAEVPDAGLDAAPAGEWSARTIMAHLRDLESLVFRMRLERMLVEDRPLFADFDENVWVASRSHARDEKTQLLGDFALQRQASLNLIASMEPHGWERAGSHPTGGDYTVRSWVERWAGHDTGHLAQLEAVLGETLEDVLRRRFHSPD